MSAHRELGEQAVAAASPKFKDFRVDFEKISNAASKMCRSQGRDEAAGAMFLDGDWDLRIPLQRRYAAAGKLEEVAHYHSKRFKLYLGRNTPWPDEPADDALTMFAEHGRADLGIQLVRTYVDMQHKRLKRDFSARNPRKPRVERDENVQKAINAISTAIAGAIPHAKADLLKDMDTLAPYVEQHGSEDDRAWFDQQRRAIWMEKRA